MAKYLSITTINLEEGPECQPGRAFIFHGSNTVTQKDVDEFIDDVFIMTIGKKTTFVQVTLKNGFTLEDSSSCVDPDNYDEVIGAGICMKKIKDKIWYLLGFLLQSATYGFNGDYK